MFIGANNNIRRYRRRRRGVVEEEEVVGEIIVIMNVRIIAYYHSMQQICQAEYFRQLLKPVT